MKRLLVWTGHTLLILFALVEMFVVVTTPMPKALVPIAIVGAILLWQAIRLQRYMRHRKSEKSGRRVHTA